MNVVHRWRLVCITKRPAMLPDCLENYLGLSNDIRGKVD